MNKIIIFQFCSALYLPYSSNCSALYLPYSSNCSGLYLPYSNFLKVIINNYLIYIVFINFYSDYFVVL